MRKFDRNSVPLDDDPWGNVWNAEAQEATSSRNVSCRNVGDKLGGRRSGFKDTSNSQPEAECMQECYEATGKGRHER